MLKAMPKVGDVIVAKYYDNGRRGIADLTRGKEYKISKVEKGTAWFYDDDKFERMVTCERFEHFTLKGGEPTVGYLEITSTSTGDGLFTTVTVEVDQRGLKTLQTLVERAQIEDEAGALKRQMASLQTKLDALETKLEAL